ncbi:opioid growth factor receptor-like protein, putative [Bodo saltans]|uniref:Opioid growth factor receptor-like protein, putative n=1 Tax=Bodo saltans TaxID=75058 RepID=A0A0S4JSR1_BODSA|nr:opioid growth factor receptor-like protein, putative [Bodo saltans]|eukprot:CUG93400.1 opioid growth factor receptor-like protein, putative [Bodo saltans]
MDSIAQQHGTAFLKFVKPRSVSKELSDFFDFVKNDIAQLVETFPSQELTMLADPDNARKYVLRWGPAPYDELSEELLHNVADEFADLVAKFQNEWLASSRPVTNGNDGSDSPDDRAPLRRVCQRFTEYLASDQVFPPSTFSISELISFLVSGKYLDETFDAIRCKDGRKLLQLALQDIPKREAQRFPASISLAEDALQEILADFHDEIDVAEDISRAQQQRGKPLSHDVNSDEEEEEEETDEAYMSNCEYLSHCIGFAPKPRFVRKYDFVDFLDDHRYFLREKAHAIRKYDSVEFARIMSLWMQEQDLLLDRLVPLKDLESDCKSLLDDFEVFNNADTYTLPSTNGIGLDHLFGGSSSKSTWGGGGGGGGNYYSNYHEVDLQKYRNNHPELKDAEPRVYQNVDFYRGACEHSYYRCYIDDFHDVDKYRSIASAATTTTSTWFGNYNRLEAEHSFIQHLFPIQEGAGLSSCSQRLQKHEIEVMKTDPAIQERLLRSTETMLDFYGILFERVAEGFKLSRCIETCDEQFRNLNIYSHNYLRITRICKCLGDLGFETLQHDIVDFFIRECFEFHTIPALQDEDEDDVKLPFCYLVNLRSSLERYWVGTIRDDTIRQSFEKRIAIGKERIQAAAKKANEESATKFKQEEV